MLQNVCTVSMCSEPHFFVFSYYRGLKAEKIAARQAILPLIQAEEDARFDILTSIFNSSFTASLKCNHVILSF